MVIKYEFLSEQLERKRHQKERIGRVVSMDHVDAVTHRHVQTHYQATKCKIGILSYITKESFALG